MVSNQSETIVSANIALSDQQDGPSGELHLRIYRGGVLVETFIEKNLIVDGSKQLLSRLLGGTVANNSVTKIGFGTSGTAPAAGNAALTNPTVKALDSITYPDASKVSFNFSLGSAEANGKAIMEFGLFSAGDVLFARRVRATALNKDTDISLAGSWVITF